MALSLSNVPALMSHLHYTPFNWASEIDLTLWGMVSPLKYYLNSTAVYTNSWHACVLKTKKKVDNK